VHPQHSKSQLLGHSLPCQEDFELKIVVLDRLLEATTKKVVNFVRKKCTPEKTPGHAYTSTQSTLPCRDVVYCEQRTMLSSLTVVGTKHVRARLDDCSIGWRRWPTFESIPRRVTIRTCMCGRNTVHDSMLNNSFFFVQPLSIDSKIFHHVTIITIVANAMHCSLAAPGRPGI